MSLKELRILITGDICYGKKSLHHWSQETVNANTETLKIQHETSAV